MTPFSISTQSVLLWKEFYKQACKPVRYRNLTYLDLLEVALAIQQHCEDLSFEKGRFKRCFKTQKSSKDVHFHPYKTMIIHAHNWFKERGVSTSEWKLQHRTKRLLCSTKKGFEPYYIALQEELSKEG
jgi:hypothetical protein